ncbi:MAG: sigma-70 family RNA polymerase sigma factor [Saprospiraceae bacterium]|nr:sigma-70 family RNA polymerase sigma factor [Saprospiraceae bacterium]MBK6785424.1 sigma-70 family RNA polymerase sigma factor [Saprospiraceae bacterium]MBK7525610.1 sigma-70 family RNA polymerase sigma factor [Saprospiraceae bacterium]MBK8081089.1 sigma-70 family RNA polymerase sigma factor [Saprospiraceae bacterium]MBK8549347.1 sigma-70 family RNA polymerase sigma factor [Saprospiraceae bacterium]
MTVSKDKKIFYEEFFPHLEALKTFAFHLTYNESDAEDLVQETYLKAYKFINSYVKGTNSKAWLFKILKNAYINEYRKKVKTPITLDFNDPMSVQEKDILGGMIEINWEDLSMNLGDEVTMAMNSISEEFKEIILLCDIEGFSYEEIAEILDLPIGTVRSRLFRARNELKDKLMKYALLMGYRNKRGIKKDIKK